jgi:tetratricopeptide (TPR) repeat protein
MKPSRLLLRLEAEIGAAKSVLEADCLRAERAGYLARLGRFEEVQQELADLHGRYDLRPNAAVSAWLNFVEGLTVYFSATGVPTTDKLKRSFALSSAVGLLSLQSLSAAWLAQFDYVRVDIDSMASNIRKSLKTAKPDHHSARSRAALVVAQALHLAGRQDLALPWYRIAREHAVADGDDATISALMHNMGWLRMMALRQTVLSGNPTVSGGEHALMNAESTNHFDLLVGDISWSYLKPILRAQILSLQGRFVDALELYERNLTASDSEGTSRLQANLLADKAWCLAKAGQVVPAAECARSASERIGADTHADDLAAAHSRLAQVFALLSNADGAAHHAAMATETWRNHESLQERIVLLLGKLSETGSDRD